MKIYLSKYWRLSSLFVLLLIAIFVIGTIAYCIWSGDDEDYIFVLCASVNVLILGCILLMSKRFLTYAVVENHQICSYSLFSKKLCCVNTTAPTYYTIFLTPQGDLGISKFIAISNEPFEYQPTYGNAKVRFIQHYNMKKQIVLPLNEQTVDLLKFDDWHKVD